MSCVCCQKWSTWKSLTWIKWMYLPRAPCLQRSKDPPSPPPPPPVLPFLHLPSKGNLWCGGMVFRTPRTRQQWRKRKQYKDIWFINTYLKQWRIQGGRLWGRNRHPLKLDQLVFLSPLSFIRMLKNKAQLARESIKTTLELPGPLSGPCMAPAESEFGSALVMCVRAHNLLRPPPQWKSWIRPC